MKTLTKAVLIQWFRLEAVEIPIIGSTAFIGDNGAGKSALLDAIQTVLTGANKSRLVLNRGSNEQSSRKLWEYVLGVMSDPKKPELATKIKPREKANCYLALNFHDEETGESLCAGVSIYASLAEMAEKVEGYFICPGLAGHKDLFLEQREGESMVVLPWARVKERLAKTCPASRFHYEPGKFTQDLYGTLSEHPGSPNNDKTILKALQAAFRLERISDPTDFIRRYMLDRDDLQIKELQSALKNYRDMADKAESVSRRVTDLTRLEGLCDKVEHARVQQAQGEFLSLKIRSEQLFEQADPLREAMAAIEESLEELKERRGTQGARLEALQVELAEKRAEQKNSDLRIQRERLQLDYDKAILGEEEVTKKIAEIRRLLQRFERHKDLPVAEPLSVSLPELLKLLPNDGLVESQLWPEKPELLDGCLAALVGAVEKSLPELSRRYDALCAGIDGLTKGVKETTEALNQMQRGKAPLQAHTKNLVEYLKKNGIAARPLCDLVDVADERWRETIESILGNIREALIVIPEQAQKAVHLYRHEARRDFPGCHIVNTTQSERWKDARREGSLADLVTSEDVHVRAFVNRRLGNIICVETEKELLKHDRAATADGMLSSGGTVSELKVLPPILGRGAREGLVATYRKKLLELSGELDETGNRKKKLGALKELLDEFQTNFADGTVSLAQLAGRRTAFAEQVGTLREKIQQLDMDKRERRLQEEIEKLEKDAKVSKDELGALEKQTRDSEREYDKKEAEVSGLEQQMDLLKTLLDEKRQDALVDPVKAAEVLLRWQEQPCADFAAMVVRADKEVKSAEKTILDASKEVVRDYTEYYLRYAAEEGDEERPEEFGDYAATIRRKRKYLVETTLAEYREKSQKALHEAEDAFRSKFVGRLIGKLESVRGTILQLNKTLERHPFHGEIYKFRSSANPEFKHIIDFAKACNSPVSLQVGGLFDPGNDPGTPHKKALDDIATALQDPKAAERLQDYRNFLVFEVEMCDTDGTPTADLEHRIQKGSGGENQTPFYVAIGASLAAAYRLKEEYGKHCGGISLAVFDEAFSKLSVPTTQSCIEFLKKIQLQLIVAAPDEKFATMAEVMDTIVWVTREGGTVETEVVYIKPSMRALLRSDNPYLKSTGTAAAEFLHEPA
uniref:SMC domain protein n=1 Tax=Geobacter sp. (strain M21) TaxID=443144 RepID=C6E1B7_GEOSM